MLETGLYLKNTFCKNELLRKNFPSSDLWVINPLSTLALDCISIL